MSEAKVQTFPVNGRVGSAERHCALTAHNRAVSESEREGSAEVVAAGGVELFARRFGDPTLPLLIVVHGGPTWDHSYLRSAVAGLADLAHVVLFDLRGCGRSSRTPPVGDLPVAALQPDLLADDVAALIRHYGAARADVLGFSYGGGIAMRVVDQHPSMVGRLILASTTAYRDHEQERESSADYQARARLCTKIAWDDPALTGPAAPDGALSRAMAYAGAPCDIWRLDRLDEWHRVLAGVRFSSDWNAPYAAGQLRPGAPDNAESVLRTWARPILILHGSREMVFPLRINQASVQWKSARLRITTGRTAISAGSRTA
jgi:pimeloyl-ACP methyl ester carboxylesterase